ncbi:MAG: glycosyltransferase family 2 protein [Candidatus Peribacteraceae bacterium]|nr:glycosyltransferase family 2 protein [Candidatus Peribacteraceae bacterium]MBP9850185.1 glycosyltransferase family 2 protein [Candidatus Peribacteraceae bacterium]
MNNLAPLVSAIVLNYRSPRDTVKCVQALKKQTIADRLEILAVDNHSCDESIGYMRAQLASLPNVRIVEQRANLGYGRGNNAAAKLARGEYILILNPDNVLPPDGVEKMLVALTSDPKAGVVGPALVYPDGSIRPSARTFPSPLDLFSKRMFPARWHAAYETERQRLLSAPAVDVDWLVGACLLLRHDLYTELGGFDERYFLFFEDIDLCRRIHALGKKVIYLSSLKVLDRKGRLSGSSIFSLVTRKTTRIHLASALKYFWKWGLSEEKVAGRR